MIVKYKKVFLLHPCSLIYIGSKITFSNSHTNIFDTYYFSNSSLMVIYSLVMKKIVF